MKLKEPLPLKYTGFIERAFFTAVDNVPVWWSGSVIFNLWLPL